MLDVKIQGRFDEEEGLLRKNFGVKVIKRSGCGGMKIPSPMICPVHGLVTSEMCGCTRKNYCRTCIKDEHSDQDYVTVVAHFFPRGQPNL